MHVLDPVILGFKGGGFCCLVEREIGIANDGGCDICCQFFRPTNTIFRSELKS